MKYFYSSAAIIWFSVFLTGAGVAHGGASAKDEEFVELLEHFADEHAALKIPIFDYSYRINFETMQNLEGIEKQILLFQQYEEKLRALERSNLGANVRYLYDLFAYEIGFNLERLALEKSYKSSGSETPVPATGLYELPEHGRWYRLYAKRWASTEISPNELLRLGHREVRKVKQRIKGIQNELGYAGNDAAFYEHLNSESFFLTDLQDVLNQYQQRQQTVFPNLVRLFLDSDIPPVDIKPAPNPDETTPPGYYTEDTFYFNFLHDRHNTRAMDWLFIHEALPGHHYHTKISEKENNPAPKFRELFWYPGHSEGWGAYTEHLGEDLGLYTDVYSKLGKWEWDLVRSARVVMDVGIHYLGWSRETSRSFWKSRISNQDSIMEREITRITKWPGQVISYKVGEAKIFELKENLKNRHGPSFDTKKFHELLVIRGSLPLPALQNLIDEYFNEHVH